MKNRHAILYSSLNNRYIQPISNHKQTLSPIRNKSFHSVCVDTRTKKPYPKSSMGTYVSRQDKDNSVTILSIRFAHKGEHKNEPSKEIHIKKNPLETATIEQNQQTTLNIPYLKSKKMINPEEYLKNVGYDPDLRIASEVYMQKVQQKKVKYINKIESLRRQLEACKGDKRHGMMQKNRIQVRLLGEEIRRKRERSILMEEQRRGNIMLQSLLNPTFHTIQN